MGIAALEDKIVQQAVVTILNQIYEVDFGGFSYGFKVPSLGGTSTAGNQRMTGRDVSRGFVHFRRTAMSGNA